jgi:tetratricopeptide (TPR) repeat protein
MAGAERAYRAALVADRRFAPAALGLANLLMWQKRPEEAAQVLAPLAILPAAPASVLDLHVRALVGAGRPENALPFSRRAAALGLPHARLGSAQLAAELGRFAEAQADFALALTADPADERARRGLARAVFGGSGDMDAAIAVVDQGLVRQWSPTLAAFKASLLIQAFRPAEALAVLEAGLSRLRANLDLAAAAAGAAAFARQPGNALSHAETAYRLAPHNPEIGLLLAEALLCAGDAPRAADLLEPLRRQAPFDPKRIALHATALRLVGDPAYAEVYDYSRLVRSFTLPTPKGWANLPAFLRDLASRLHALHDARGPMLDQSVRGGSQVHLSPAHVADPVLRALFAALETPIADYVAGIGRGGAAMADPLAARSDGTFALGGAWSVRLRPGPGHHIDHIHREGWISSAFYVDLPGAVGDTSRDGWIRFGAPNLPLDPPLPAEHWVQPQAGQLVLFPSYMWHGTLPFSGAQPRLTFACDIVPKTIAV